MSLNGMGEVYRARDTKLKRPKSPAKILPLSLWVPRAELALSYGPRRVPGLRAKRSPWIVPAGTALTDYSCATAQGLSIRGRVGKNTLRD